MAYASITALENRNFGFPGEDGTSDHAQAG
jgi:hypothetical protein